LTGPLPTEQAVVQVEGVRKRYGTVTALAGMDLTVERGEIVAVLGPNGAGKTTLVGVLVTLVRPDAGRAFVAGHDVVLNPAAVRRAIAVTGQYAAVDGELTGRENLVLFGRLHGLPRRAAAARADELLERFDLTAASRRPARTYSGGMRRRLDLAASLVVRPTVLFLDEPTTGLDPRSRLALWEAVRGLRALGVTVVLTTQYLEEADQLADRVVVVDRGQVIASGPVRDLKDAVGGTICKILPADPRRLDDTVAALAGLGASTTDGWVSLPAPGGAATLAEAIRRLDAAGVALDDISLRRPSLDDVFLALTGRPS
jgi:ABC-2 type transport system ATP-binding protein